MSNIVKVSGFDQRNNVSDWKNNDLDRRKKESKYLTTEQLDCLLNNYNTRYLYLIELIKDKEKKKLTIITSSFAVFSLLVTYILSVSTGATVGDIEKITSFPFLFVSLVFLSSISVINISIIKYIVSLKEECLLAIRQLNCIRQAINSIMFSKLEGYLPKTIDKEIFEGTIRDKTTKYWDIYGRHEKYPLNNFHLRDKYNSWKIFFICFTSSDMFAVFAISMFTILLASLPIMFLVRYVDVLQKFSIGEILFLGSVSTILIFGFIVLVGGSIIMSLRSIKKTLNKDETVSFDSEEYKTERRSGIER